MSKLPFDWKCLTIKDIALILNGGTPDTKISEYWEGEHNWLTPAEMGKRDDPYIEESRRKLTDIGLQNSSAKVAPPYSVILSSRAPIGHLAINTQPMGTNQGCKILVPSKNIYYKYLYYYLLCNVKFLNELGSGTTFKELSSSKLKEVQIPLPPLPEQKRIVAILDEAFAAIDTAIANTEKNQENAKELFESYLNRVFSEKGEGWEEKRLGDVCTKIGSGSTPKGGKESYLESGISLIRSLNVHDRYFKKKDLAFISDKQASKLSNVSIVEGDVLLNITGASVARSCVVPPSYLPARVNQHVSILRPIQSLITSKFLNYLLTSQEYKKILLNSGEKAGSTRQALTKSQLENFTISFPIINKQNEYLEKFDLISDEVTNLGNLLKNKIDLLGAFKQSILQKAFTGELTSKSIDNLDLSSPQSKYEEAHP